MAAKKKADAAVENTAEVTQETTEQVQDTVEQMTEDNKKELDNKKYVVDHLLSTKREGMEDLIDYMEQIGFFEAPCMLSGKLNDVPSGRLFRADLEFLQRCPSL